MSKRALDGGVTQEGFEKFGAPSIVVSSGAVAGFTNAGIKGWIRNVNDPNWAVSRECRDGSVSALGMEGTHGDNEVLVIQSPITTKQAADSTTLLVLEAQRGRSADFDAGWIMGA